ncbi:sensor histidine kinase [Dermatobacter hominis]|uniref:sensor histidine kinase n=1 Tax=Dermatobacter hominis TaxID=2884263 RepID=UPI001D11C2CC|nr:sensor histidine kinase [Dermatobacter hominis]UDY37544.1 hypothetical protein LH044_08385 [Dermatobacter hominis]
MRAAPDRTADVGAVRDMSASLRRGYARYQVAIATTAVARRVLDRDAERSPWRDAAIAAIAAGAAGSVVSARLRPADDEVTAWWDALASAGASASGLVAAPVATTPGAWPAASREASAMAQWASAGASLLGGDGPGRAARLAAIAAPYVLWPRGRRSLRRSRRLYEAAAALAVFGISGRTIVGILRSTAAAVDQRSEQVVAERAEVATLEEQARVREVVIAETAARLRSVRRDLTTDRPAAEARARAEERRLRSWLTEEGSGDPALATATAGPATDAADAARRIARFGTIAESVLRSGAAAQLVVEAATARRPMSARLLAAAGVGHAAWSCWRLLGSRSRGPVVAADLGVLGLCGALEVVESRRGWEPGWTRGYSEALFAATGCVPDDRRLGRAAVVGVAAVSGAATLALPADGPPRALAAAERSASAAMSAALGHWFARLVTELGGRMTTATEQLAAVRSAAAAEQIRRDAQYLLHDSALQVLLWVQKPDLSDEQLLAWLDREVDHLERAAAGSIEAPGLATGLDELVRGFRLLGLTAVASLDGDVAPVSTAVGAAALDVCNEGLANVLRHSSDRSPVVRLAAAGDELTVVVTNRVDEPVLDVVAGTGTRAMTDRARAVGGTLEVGPVPDGFRVVARFPLPAGDPTY